MADLDVTYVAKLARLRLTNEEAQLFQAQLGDVLAFAAQLREVDVSGVEPAAHLVPMFDVMRADEERDWFTADDALANAPRAAHELFVVPKVIE